MAPPPTVDANVVMIAILLLTIQANDTGLPWEDKKIRCCAARTEACLRRWLHRDGDLQDLKRRHVNSETFRSLGYDSDAQMMEAEFRSGEVYRYFGVPVKLWRSFVAAASKGRFFAGNIRDFYKYKKVARDRAAKG